MNPIVSVIVPVYNGENYVDSCMKGMQKQTYSNLEIILVNDGSKDSTGEKCDAWAKDDSRVIVIHQTNKGLSGARNAGIQKATGKYVVFIDVDDEIESNLIKDNVELAEKYNADLVMYCFWYYDVDRKQLKANAMEHLFVGSKKEYFDNMLIPTMDHEVFNAPWNKLIKKSVLTKNQVYFDSTFPIYEDIIFAPKLLSVCNQIVVNNQMYYKYFVRSSGSLITKFYENFFECISEYYKYAMKYCAEFENNAAQIARMSKLYATLGIMHIKQISCQKTLSKEKKYQLIRNICEREVFVKALDISQLNCKKRIIRRLVKGKKYRMCYFIYQIGSLLD